MDTSRDWWEIQRTTKMKRIFRAGDRIKFGSGHGYMTKRYKYSEHAHVMVAKEAERGDGDFVRVESGYIADMVTGRFYHWRFIHAPPR